MYQQYNFNMYAYGIYNNRYSIFFLIYLFFSCNEIIVDEV